MVETWRDIPGYGGKYQVDMEGNVRRVYASGRTRGMTPYHRRMSGSQRLVVKLTRDGREKEEVLMRLVALAFLGPPPRGCVPYQAQAGGEDRQGRVSGGGVPFRAGGRKAELHELPDGDGPVQRQGERRVRARRICVCMGRQRSQHKTSREEDRAEEGAEKWEG